MAKIQDQFHEGQKDFKIRNYIRISIDTGNGFESWSRLGYFCYVYLLLGSPSLQMGSSKPRLGNITRRRKKIGPTTPNAEA